MPTVTLLKERTQPGVSHDVARVFAWLNNAPDVERRSSPRYPFPYPIQILPLDTVEPARPFSVIGGHISHQSVDFYYHEPIPSRLVCARLAWGEQAVELMLELNWCRFASHGWYVNVGKIVPWT